MAKKVAKTGIKQELGYHYFIDLDGDIAREKLFQTLEAPEPKEPDNVFHTAPMPPRFPVLRYVAKNIFTVYRNLFRWLLKRIRERK